ncbi:MAG TPA: HD domain-containing protein [Solirubrobacteraceae bacterium]|nr:HD domain-containing protein [Solirubrobacteraceae bacterium]
MGEHRAGETVEEILAACRSMVGLPYDGEPVDQLEHALQCAHLARSHGGEREFVIACLLHDIARAPAVAGIPYDGPREHHGETAARWLEPRVGARIAWLAEQHVPAKRYLVATDPAYRGRLSDVSARTLRAQGGPMSDEEVSAFRSNADWQLAVRLREIDDAGKVPGASVPDLDAYEDDLLAVVVARLCAGT